MSDVIEETPTIKYVDIIKKGKNGEKLITKTMTPNDFTKINAIGAKVKEVEQAVSDLSDVQNARNNAQDTALQTAIADLTNRIDQQIQTASGKTDFEIEQLRSQQSSLKTRVEEVFNNGIDEIQQRRIEALERVDLQELADIEKAAQDIEELRANGLTDMAALQAKDLEHDGLIAANTAAIADLRELQTAKDTAQDVKIQELSGKLDSAVDSLSDDIEINKNNIEVLGTSIIDLRTSTASSLDSVQADITALQDSINSDITSKLNTLSEGQAAKNLEQDLEIQKLQESTIALQESDSEKLVAVEGLSEVPNNATEYEIYFVEAQDHIVF